MDSTIVSFQSLLIALVAGLFCTFIGWVLGNAFGSSNSSRLLEERNNLLHLKELEAIALRASVADKESISARLESANASLATSQEELCRMEEELTAARQTCRELETTLTGIGEMLTAREQDIEEAKARYLAQSADNRSLSESFEKLTSDFQDLTERVAELQRERDRHLSLLDQAAGREKELQARIAAGEAAMEQVGLREVEIGKLRRRIGVLEPFEIRCAELERETSKQAGELTPSRTGGLKPLQLSLAVGDGKRRVFDKGWTRETATHGGDRAMMVMAPAAAGKLDESHHPGISIGEGRTLTEEEMRGTVSAAKDDLKTIQGIGPAIERLLNNNGVFSYQQIARWGAEDLTRYEQLLKSSRGRIRRDDWVARAREQHQQKYGELL